MEDIENMGLEEVRNYILHAMKDVYDEDTAEGDSSAGLKFMARMGVLVGMIGCAIEMKQKV